VTLGPDSGTQAPLRVQFIRLKWAHSSDDRHTETDQQPSSIIAHEARRSANGATKEAPPGDFTRHGTICWAQRLGDNNYSARFPALIGIAAAAFVAAYVLAIDGLLFRSQLSESYVKLVELPLSDRLIYFMLRAFNENVIYRLFVFGGLFYLTGRHGKRPSIAIAAMVAAQSINIGINVVYALGDSISFSALAYDSVRYVAPGVLWAWLFWRFGFVVAEVASVGSHVFLQPASVLFFDPSRPLTASTGALNGKLGHDGRDH
jgi:hypothetical protein